MHLLPYVSAKSCAAKVSRVDIMICTLLPFVLDSKAIPN